MRRRGVRLTRVLLGAVLGTVLVGLPVGPPARAQVSDAVVHFDEGNQKYREGDYQGAVASYEAALAGGYASGALYYNLGNAHYRLDRLGQAIRYYEKARTLMPDNVELQHNLSYVRSQTVDQFSRLPVPVWITWWQGLVRVIGAGGLFAVGMVFYVVATAWIVHRIRTGTRNPWHRRGLTASAILAALFLAAAFAASLQGEQARTSVVIVDEVGLRAAPRRDAATDLAIHEGLVLDVLQAQAGWVEVRLPNGATGWVEADALGDV